jgi:hypothetical protein
MPKSTQLKQKNKEDILFQTLQMLTYSQAKIKKRKHFMVDIKMYLMHFLILKLGKRVKVIALKAPIKQSTILSLKEKKTLKY